MSGILHQTGTYRSLQWNVIWLFWRISHKLSVFPNPQLCSQSISLVPLL